MFLCRHHLFTRMLGTVKYMSRAEYADREVMLSNYVNQLELEGALPALRG
jgi:hypothetical protein